MAGAGEDTHLLVLLTPKLSQPYSSRP